jgi:hypothetical protein
MGTNSGFSGANNPFQEAAARFFHLLLLEKAARQFPLGLAGNFSYRSGTISSQ